MQERHLGEVECKKSAVATKVCGVSKDQGTRKTRDGGMNRLQKQLKKQDCCTKRGKKSDILKKQVAKKKSKRVVAVLKQEKNRDIVKIANSTTGLQGGKTKQERQKRHCWNTVHVEKIAI